MDDKEPILEEEQNGGTPNTEEPVEEPTNDVEDENIEKQDDPKKENTEDEIKEFTKTQVTEMIKGKVDKIYQHCGVKSSKELAEVVEKAKSYDVVKGQYADLQLKHADLQKQMSFMKNNIDDARIDDINAYFKGKELEFSDEALIKELETHPEWVKQVAPQPQVTVLGSSKQEIKHGETEEEKMKRIFGI